MRTMICVIIAVLAGAPAVGRADRAPLRLAEALEIARKNSPLLHKAEADRDAAQARVGAARARLLPQVVGTATYQHTTANFVPRPGFSPSPTLPIVTDAAGNVLDVQPGARRRVGTYEFVDSYNFQIAASQLIYDFGATHKTLSAEHELARAARNDEQAMQLAVDYGVRNAFFLTRAQRALVRVAEETVENQRQHLVQVEALVEVGRRPEIDLAQARADLANARVRLVSAQNAHALAMRNLSIAMGEEVPHEYEVSDELFAPLADETALGPALWAEAARTRPELAALRRKLIAQTERVRAAKGRYGPALSATAGTSKAGIQLGDLTWNAFVGATLSWTLIGGGATLYAKREASANQRGLAAELNALLLRIQSEVEQARLNIQAAKATVEAADDALLNARARLHLAEGRYEAGVGNAIELGDAQLGLAAADAQRVQSEYDLAVARAQLLKALGKAQ